MVAAAASVVDDAACLAALREPFVVWLRAPAAVLARRMAEATRADDHRRPLGDASAVAELEARRADRFGAVADLTIDTVSDGTTTGPDAIVATIMAALQPAAVGAPVTGHPSLRSWPNMKWCPISASPSRTSFPW